MHDHRVIRGPSLHLEDLAHGGGIGGVRAEAVDGLGWKHHQVPGAQCLDGFFDFGLSSSYHGLMIIKTGSVANADWGADHTSVAQCRFSATGGRLEDALEELQVEPAPKLESHFTKMSYAAEAHALVHANGGHIVGIDAGDHDVLAKRSGA